MSALLEARGLVKSFPAAAAPVRAVDGVDLVLARGAFAVLAGPSGSGKTTLLNLLSGLERPDAGEIALEGVRLDRLPAAALARLRLERIGLVFQAANLVPVLTAGENAEFILELRGVARRERRRTVEALFERLGIGGLEGRFPGELSGGEQQRVAVARALAGAPALVLADEPTANLDSTAAAALVDLLCAVNRERGLTLLLASHDPRVVNRAGRAIFLRDGRIAGEEGRPG
jgi:putative ABC transport system ATP-binding protein